MALCLRVQWFLANPVYSGRNLKLGSSIDSIVTFYRQTKLDGSNYYPSFKHKIWY